MSNTEDQTFKTRAASDYLRARGLAASPSYLEKCRTRGPEDRRDRGPDYHRDPNGICWYSKGNLDDYVVRRLAARKFREPISQPPQLRSRGVAS